MSEAQARPEQQRVPCPFCAEAILPGASVCRYCGRTTGFVTQPEPHPQVAGVRQDNVGHEVKSTQSESEGFPWLAAIIITLLVAAAMAFIYQWARQIDGTTHSTGSAAISQPESTNTALTEWFSGISSDMASMGNDLAEASSAIGAGQTSKAIRQLNSAGETLTQVPESPDGGQLSSSLRLAGRRYLEAASALAAGDVTAANARMNQANEVLGDVTARINQLLAEPMAG